MDVPRTVPFRVDGPSGRLLLPFEADAVVESEGSAD
jgi:hypothetical protein